MFELSETVDRKFTDVIDIDEWEVETDTGWEPISAVSQTIPYVVWELKTEQGKYLKCADDHILFAGNGEQIFAKDCLNEYIITKDGVERVIYLECLEYEENMYDLTVESENHTFYSNDILSHNTTTLAAYILWKVTFNEDFSVGITSNKESSAIDFASRIKYAYENLPFFLKPEVQEYAKKKIAFTNYSTVEASTTTEETFRGRSFNLTVCDEIAFVKPDVAEEFMASILPTISTAGENAKMVLISTPNGTEDIFSDTYFKAMRGESDFAISKVDVETEIPEFDEEFRKSMLKKMSVKKYNQEFLCHFISDKGTLIDSFVLEDLEPSQPIHTFSNGEFRQFLSIDKRMLGVSVDVGEGVEDDYHAIQVFDINTLEQVAEYRNNTLSQTLFVKEVIKIFKYLWEEGAVDIYYTVENNGVGIGVINLIINSNSEWLDNATFVNEKEGKFGIAMTTKSKQQGTSLLKDLMETERMTVHSNLLISEMKFFVKRGSTYAAEGNKKDDLVMSTVLFCLLLEQLKNFEEEVWDTLNDVSLSTEASELEEAFGIAF